MILWSALRPGPGYDILITTTEALEMGFKEHQFTESVGGGWAWFWDIEDAKRASPVTRIMIVA